MEYFRDAYLNNGNLAVFASEDGGETIYGVVTVNLVDDEHPDTYELTDSNCAFLDTNNSGDLAQDMIARGLCEMTGRWARSGFCTYPEGRISESVINWRLAGAYDAGD